MKAFMALRLRGKRRQATACQNNKDILQQGGISVHCAMGRLETDHTWSTRRGRAGVVMSSQAIGTAQNAESALMRKTVCNPARLAI